MSYASVMVSVDLGPDFAPRVKLAVDVASRFGARLIGVAARQPNYAVVGDPSAVGPLIAADQQAATEELQDAEVAFLDAAGAHDPVAFRSAIQAPDAFLVEQARAADLIVVGRQGADDHSDWRFSIDPGAVVMQCGRPVLITPPQVNHLAAKRVILAWRDTREARRAVCDSLPLLKKSDEVLIVAVSEDGRSAGAIDVQDYLKQHGIAAKTLVRAARDTTVADELLKAAEQEGADLIVAGAYGHTRLREWILGGVSRDLLDHSPVCCLMAH